MNAIWFLLLNLFLLGFFIYGFKKIWYRAKKSDKIRARDNGDEVLFYIDFAYPIGIAYSALCSMIFLLNIFLSIILENTSALIASLNSYSELYYFMAAVSLGNAFLIIPERSKIIHKYQYLFILSTIFWLLWAITIAIIKVNLNNEN